MSVFIIAAVVLAAACQKERTVRQNPLPGFDMDYMDLTGKEIGFNQSVRLDLNRDNRTDIIFTTLLVGDPIGNLVKAQYIVSADFFSSLPVDAEEHTPVHNNNDSIPVTDFGNYNWYNAAYIVLAEKITPVSQEPYWTGNWKNIQHKYLPIQVKAKDKRYNGWIELSFDTGTQQTILHRAAISRIAECAVRAGV